MEQEQPQVQEIGGYVFKIITGELIIGDATVIPTANGTEYLIKQPFTSINGTILPYLSQELGSGPGGIQFHHMNTIWGLPITEFPNLKIPKIEKDNPNDTNDSKEVEAPSIVIPGSKEYPY